MSRKGIVYLLMILNVNIHANVILERSLRANEGCIGVNESRIGVNESILAELYAIQRHFTYITLLTLSLLN